MARRELLEAASRLTAALERLALEDEEWESVSTVSVPHTTTATSEVAKGKGKSSPPPICGSSVAFHSDTRYYIVLSNPYRPSTEGCWYGPAAFTWRALEKQLRGERLAGSGARLRRVKDLQEARELWTLHRPNEEMPVKEVEG